MENSTHIPVYYKSGGVVNGSAVEINFLFNRKLASLCLPRISGCINNNNGGSGSELMNDGYVKFVHLLLRC